MTRAWRVMAVFGIGIVLTACKVDATLVVRVRENGSGAVTVRVELDRAAVRAAEIGGGTLDTRVRLADLPAAGWTVTPWRRASSGAASLVVRKRFTRPAQVTGLIAELNGAAGPWRGFRASRTSSTFTTAWTVRGTVDLRSIDTGVMQDPELVAKLTAERVDISGLDERLTRGLRTGLRVRAVAELPDHRTVVAATPGHREMLSATADETDNDRVLLLGGGIGVGVLALLILIVGERRARRNRTLRG